MKRRYLWTVALILVLFLTSCGSAKSPAMAPEERSYPIVVNADRQELYLGMTTEELAQALDVDIGEHSLLFSPAEGLIVMIHEEQVRQIQIDAGWTLKDEPGVGSKKADVLAVRGEPDRTSTESIYADLDTGEAAATDLPELYSISYAIGEGSLSYIYDTEETIVFIALQDFSTMEALTAK